MSEFKVIQAAMPTSTGVQSYTSPGFGTPKGAIFFGGYGTSNGAAVDHAGFFFGMTDGTRSNCRAWASEHGQATSDPGNIRSTTSPVLTQLNSTQAEDGRANFSQWVTDGVELDWTDAPPSAYLMTVILIGGTGVSNVYVGTAATPSVVDTATDVTAPNFQPDIVIMTGNHENAGSLNCCVGIATGDSTQRSLSEADNGGASPTQTRSELSSTRILKAANSAQGVEIGSFDSQGFSLTLRGTTGTAVNTNYIAIKLNGLSAKLLTSASPTATGNHTITGAGFTPQFGLMLHSECAAVDTQYLTDDGEVFGVSAFATGGVAYSSAFSVEDGALTSDTDSITDAAPVRIIKDGASYMEATLGAFTSDGVTFNYSVTPGAAKQRAVLFIESGSTDFPMTAASGSYVITGIATVLRNTAQTWLRLRKP